MSMSLNTVFQNATNVSADRAATTKVYINTAGNVSNTSGLNWFQRNFQASSQKRENQNTLANFKTAIENSPKYRTLAENDHGITVFFQRKQRMGTPLTAAHVQAIQNKLEGLYQQKIASAFQQQKIWGPEMATNFKSFCADYNMPLDTEPEIAAAFKGFAVHVHATHLLLNTLRELHISHDTLMQVVQLLTGSPTWQAMLDSAFAPGANFSNEGVQQALQKALKPYIEAVSTVLQDPTVNEYLENNPDAGRKLLIDVGEMVSKGTLPSADVVDICKTCIAEGFTLSTPAGTYAAVLHLWKERLTTNMLQTAIGENFPPTLGQALAKSPQFKEILEKALYKHFPPPTIPTAEAFTTFMNTMITTFWTDRKERIGQIFDFAKQPKELSPGLQGLAGVWSEERICQLLPLLLKTDALLDHLLVPGHRADAAYLTLLAEFQALVDTHSAETAQNILAQLLSARGADEAVLGTLLDTIIARTKALDPSLHALGKQLSTKTRKLKEPTTEVQAQKDITHVRNALQSLARFAHAATTQEQRQKRKVAEDAGAFITAITTAPDTAVRENFAFEPAVANWGQSITDINSSVYSANFQIQSAERNKLFKDEGTKVLPTAHYKKLMQEYAKELGMDQFIVNDDMDTSLIRQRLVTHLTYNKEKSLTAQEGEAIVKETLKEYLTELKASLNYIASVPDQQNIDAPEAFYMTAAEKQQLAKHLPYHSVRGEAELQTIVLLSRTMKGAMGVLALAQSTPEERYCALRQIAAAYNESIRTVPGLWDGLSAPKHLDTPQHQGFNLALALAVHALNLSDDEKIVLHDFLAGEEGTALCGYIASAHEQEGLALGSPAADNEIRIMSCCIGGMHKLSDVLSNDLGLPVDQEKMQYNHRLSRAKIPSYIWQHSFPGELKKTSIIVDTALNAISPTLNEDQRDILRPLLTAAASGTGKPFDRETSIRFMATYAHEILSHVSALRGAPLTVGHLWHIIFDQRPGWFLNESNFADRMYTKAMNTLYDRAKAMGHHLGSFAHERKSLERSLSLGIPLADICQSCRPGGLLTLNKLTSNIPTMPPLPDTQDHNDYNLADTWRRKKRNIHGMTTNLHIKKPGETAPKEYAQNPEFAKKDHPQRGVLHNIVTDCKTLCGGNGPQLKRVLQCFSQDAVEPLCRMSELLPGTTQPLSKDAPLSILVEKEGKNIRVNLANHPSERPWGVHISILVTPEGTATYDDVRMVRRG